MTFLLSLSVSAINLDIALFYQDDITTAEVEITSGTYRIKGDYDHLGKYTSGTLIRLSADNEQVVVTVADSVMGKYRAVAFRGERYMNNFRINPVRASLEERFYDDDLKITAQNGYLRMINQVGLEKYIAGVVQSEGGGSSKNIDYYQVQAITCRTFALNNVKKHKEEGFHMCDGVHCQVYKGRAVNSDILMAVMRTSGEVIVDENNQMILAAFHSNCGGQTNNSEDVWSIPLSYLKSVSDTFCVHMPNARWKFRISRKRWLDYLAETHHYDRDDAGALDSVLMFRQDERKKYLIKDIRLRAIRDDLGLASAFFDIQVEQDSVVFTGKGYGHGVGLCQEGAMKMAQSGYSYDEIIRYYYYNVRIVNYHELPYLLEEFRKDSLIQF
ncbi:MAG: SpoIID/LytB domain-containing protein [Bacteroidales bacterium]